MPAPFSIHRRRAAEIVDRMMGQPVRIVPQLALAKRPLAADASRPSVDLTARFTLAPKELGIEGQRRGTDLGGFTLMQGAEAMLTVSPSEADKLTYQLRQGDGVTLLAPDPGVWPRWSVLTPQPSGGNPIVVSLTREP